jgi:hypothetical protein
MNGQASRGSDPPAYSRLIERHCVASSLHPAGASPRSNGTTIMTNTHPRPGFLRLFLGGFALGAVALVGVQVTQPAQASTWEAPVEAAAN